MSADDDADELLRLSARIATVLGDLLAQSRSQRERLAWRGAALAVSDAGYWILKAIRARETEPN